MQPQPWEREAWGPASWARVAVLVLGVAALAVTAVAVQPLRMLPDSVAPWGPAAAVVAVLVGAVLLAALVPRTPISVACGLLFGPVVGTICAIAVAAAGAAVTFGLGRVLGRDVVNRLAHERKRLGRAFDRIEGWIAHQGVLAVAAVRSWPLGPYGLVGYAYGTSGVRVRDYALGTLIAATPSAVVYATLGAAAGGAGTHPATYALLPFGLVLTAVVAWRTRAQVRAEAGLTARS